MNKTIIKCILVSVFVFGYLFTLGYIAGVMRSESKIYSTLSKGHDYLGKNIILVGEVYKR